MGEVQLFKTLFYKVDHYYESSVNERSRGPADADVPGLALSQFYNILERKKKKEWLNL